MTKRAKRDRETTEYLQAAARFIRGAGRRVADSGDEIELAQLIALEQAHKAAVQAAIDGMVARGCSWSYIAEGTGTTKEGAWKRWGKNR